ncbi:MAG: helix-turn-helix domain-containing protein [Alphaproteobacteria bacterium]|nr:helix-turn-helix domain-containing protein [Alphaproteobacteria bacterium]
MILLGLFLKHYETIGERVQALRRALGATRRDFSKKHNIPEPTLRILESAQADISSKQLHKLIKAFEAEGIICPQEWLLKGQGIEPSAAKGLVQREIDSMELDETLLIDPVLVEAACFQKYTPDSIVLQVTDEMMSPLYKRDDYVGGVKVSLSFSASLHKESCIIELENGTKLIRIIHPGSKGHLFNLSCLNPNDPSKYPFYVDANPKEIYQIVWHRKNIKIQK